MIVKKCEKNQPKQPKVESAVYTRFFSLPVSNSGYGIGKSGEFCTEESPLNPISLYGQTKVQSESIIMERENSISFRLATVFGMSPRMRLDVSVNMLTYQALKNGKITVFGGNQTRPNIHIKDMANVYRHFIFFLLDPVR